MNGYISKGGHSKWKNSWPSPLKVTLAPFCEGLWPHTGAGGIHLVFNKESVSSVMTVTCLKSLEPVIGFSFKLQG